MAKGKKRAPKFNPKAQKRRDKRKAPVDPFSLPFRQENYRITAISNRFKKTRILDDLTADLSKYQDDREPVMPGKTIRNEFKKYPWKNSSYDTVKG
ncbi:MULTISPECIES: hypothetical protein [Rhizobium]|uniref:hypothetical protein n=1 Tax=Rhizobium TaxID=379 RepID=UPI001105D3B5|nr:MULTISPECIES: hypothetical protein [Rhizobium]MBY5737177.1 hypothetical protein [Rhizobium leguminosarum]MCW1749811.1 hypothetical protein [Rhizobium acaciae]QKK31116.1 hypothetical protein FE844_016705 [Rhizobium indicum]